MESPDTRFIKPELTRRVSYWERLINRYRSPFDLFGLGRPTTHARLARSRPLELFHFRWSHLLGLESSLEMLGALILQRRTVLRRASNHALNRCMSVVATGRGRCWSVQYLGDRSRRYRPYTRRATCWSTLAREHRVLENATHWFNVSLH